MGQCLLYRAEIVTFNLIYSLLNCAFFWSMFICNRCYKHKLQTRIINNFLDTILRATSPCSPFHPQPPIRQEPLFIGLLMSYCGPENKSSSVLRCISVIGGNWGTVGCSQVPPKVLLGHPFLEERNIPLGLWVRNTLCKHKQTCGMLCHRQIDRW